MIKLICMVKRRSDLSYQEFSDYWRNHHGALIKQYAGVLGIKRYVQSRPLGEQDGGEQGELAQRRNMQVNDFDGIAELWYDDLASHLAPRKSKAGAKALAQIIDDERRFIDLAASRMWYSAEERIL